MKNYLTIKKKKAWWKIKIDDTLIFVKSCPVFYSDILSGIFTGEQKLSHWIFSDWTNIEYSV